MRTRGTAKPRIVMLVVIALLGGCGESEDAREARAGLRAAYETLRGAPSGDAMAERTRFEGAGVAFDYPKPLRRSYEAFTRGQARDGAWTLRYGLYEVELWVSPEPQDAHVYLATIADAIIDSEGGKVTEPAGDGRTVVLCGEDVVAQVVGLSYQGINARIEAFALPPSGDGRHRLLKFTDQRQGEASSPVADATAPMVLSSLACQPGTAMPVAEQEST